MSYPIFNFPAIALRRVHISQASNGTHLPQLPKLTNGQFNKSTLECFNSAFTTRRQLLMLKSGPAKK